MISSSPAIINLAPTGMVASRSDNEHLPVTPEEIAQDGCACIAAGASMIHLHARDAKGHATADPQIFADIIGRIRQQHPDVILIVTTSGRFWQDYERRSAVLALDGKAKPDMASLTMGSVNFSGQAGINDPDMIQRLAITMRDRDIKPEMEIFDLGMINYSKYLIKKGIIKKPYYFNIIMGNVSSAQATLLHVATLVNDLPEDSIWCLAGIGRAQLSMNVLGLTAGYGVRVGLEDNLWTDSERKIPASNVAMVKRIAALANLLNRPPALPEATRSLLGLPCK
ncbi:MAG: 3-keto-5-aminohexanoate cleavage protein [Magnetococcus sp. DMHC-1]|nr:3-keto-5-aminohexanoate cleavage protein [Magnetococcales bacterium]